MHVGDVIAQQFARHILHAKIVEDAGPGIADRMERRGPVDHDLLSERHGKGAVDLFLMGFIHRDPHHGDQIVFDFAGQPLGLHV